MEEDDVTKKGLSVDMKPQVPGITTQKEKKEVTTELKNEEFYWRANQYICN